MRGINRENTVKNSPLNPLSKDKIFTRCYILGVPLKSTPFNCSQYSNDLDVLKSLPFNVTILNASENCPSLPCCVKLNSQKQAVYFRAYEVPETVQVYCLRHLNFLWITGDKLLWHVPFEIGYLTQLSELYLRAIAGREISDSIGKLELLETLYLTGTALEEVPSTLAALSNLKSLSIEAPLKNLPSFISVLPLNILYISERFSEFPKDFFRTLNPTLRRLTIGVSHPESSLDTFSDLANLQSLYLTVDNLIQFPWQLTALTALRTLGLEGSNHLSYLPQNFSTTLESVRLNQNDFSEIPEQILLNENLKSLSLSQNRIVDLSRALTRIRGPLNDLFLSGNSVQTLPNEISSLSETLEFLKLSNNRLSTVPAEELVKMKKLLYLDLQGNPISADEIIRLKAIFATDPKLTVFF